MRQRLERGRLHTAHRGALFHGVPMGDVRLPTGDVDVDPDAHARAVLPLLFAQLDRRGALSGVLHSLVRQHIGLPRRARTGPQTGQVPWRRPSLATRSQVCHPPLYAGASASGRRPIARQGTSSGHPARRQQC
jgi:hypothetical protein